MSQYKVRKLNKPINCAVEVPGSKSITNRALLMAALSDGECRLNGVLFSDDSDVAREDACKIEHDISEESFTAIRKLMQEREQHPENPQE